MKRDKRALEFRKTVLRRLGIVVLIFLLVVVVRGTWRVYNKRAIALGARNEAQHELDQQTTRRDELATQVARLESTRGLEEELRASFPVALPGEEVVVITRENKEPDVLRSAVDSEEESTYARLREWFLGLFK